MSAAVPLFSSKIDQDNLKCNTKIEKKVILWLDLASHTSSTPTSTLLETKLLKVYCLFQRNVNKHQPQPLQYICKTKDSFSPQEGRNKNRSPCIYLLQCKTWKVFKMPATVLTCKTVGSSGTLWQGNKFEKVLIKLDKRSD
jgi:hypothetical protein